MLSCFSYLQVPCQTAEKVCYIIVFHQLPGQSASIALVTGEKQPVRMNRFPELGKITQAGNVWTFVCQLPPASSRRLGFTSGLHRNSEYLRRRSALASLSDASGYIDKVPVLIQSCRNRSVRSVTFLAPIRSAWRVYRQLGFWHTKSNPLPGRFSSSVCPQMGHAFEV